ncbi:MAG: DUF2971 domain-containing protein [Akkermansiaceae bacterium]|jgi:hypothetical protein
MILYKFRSYEQLHYIADIIVNERLYCSKLDELNDPFEGHCTRQIKRQIKSVFESTGEEENLNFTINEHWTPFHNREESDKIRICSLSGSMSDVRLWSFYGGSHKGVAIGIELDVDECFRSDADFGVIKVNSNHTSLPIFEDDGADPNSIPLRQVVTNKTSIWSYEDEYRIITSKRFHSVNGKIREIITGPRMTSDEQEVISRIAAGVPIFKSRLNPRNLSVEKSNLYDPDHLGKGIREAISLPISND